MSLVGTRPPTVDEWEKYTRCRGNGHAEATASDGEKFCEEIPGGRTLCLLRLMRWQMPSTRA